MQTLKQFLVPKVYCIIVTYNGEKWIEKCISSISEENIELQIIVIDNGSKDKTINLIEKKFPLIKLIKSEKNLGFAAANNLGYKYALENRAEYIYLLNQDTISYPNTIYNLIKGTEQIDDNKIGIISPIHLNDKGTALDKQFESYINSASAPNIISDCLLDKKKSTYQIGFVNAAAWLIKTETVSAVGGLFSSAFFHYGEDVNFIGRLKFHCYKNYLITNTFIHHCREERKGGTSKDFINMELFIKSKIKLYDLNAPLKDGIIGVFKYSFNALFKGRFKDAISLLLYPLINYNRILKIRKSYVTGKII